MSQEGVDVVRRSYEAFAKGDVPGVLDTLDPEVEWRDSDTLPTGGTMRGHDEFVKHLESYFEVWEWFRTEPERMLDAGECVVVTGRMSGRAKAGGEFDAPFAHLWWMRDGKAVRVEEYKDTAKMLEALGAGRGA